ncbi:ribose-5-phosphate isomerase RpiA [Salimicrobium halophilum]|uniref:Ribose 5-phosphate isomerase A n=1 Tax=Salimicrobium halophilum TaxID=86666 RepID=A0A1G8S9T2_9BACI|nr:ribose-5-phosphate isomerase RpiA [Salimicrobium halophilum]SDJ25988.1 ribose-5-phosphate isomerase [Salimicrobium halophilum]
MMNHKQKAAEAALSYVKDGMTIGLGSGSTAEAFIHMLAGRDVIGVASSRKTEKLAASIGIPLKETDEIDVAVDGTDAIDASLNLVKGGGGSLVREKIVGRQAREYIIIAGEEKWRNTLDGETIPVEVVPFLFQGTKKLIDEIGGASSLRCDGKGDPFVTDNGNRILDVYQVQGVRAFHEEVIRLPGVVDTGVFPELADAVILAGDTVRTERRHKL